VWAYYFFRYLQFFIGFLVENLNCISLVYQYLFHRKVLDLNGNDNGVILVWVHAFQINIREGYRWHSPLPMYAGYEVDKLDAPVVLFLTNLVAPLLMNPLEIVFIVSLNSSLSLAWLSALFLGGILPSLILVLVVMLVAWSIRVPITSRSRATFLVYSNEAFEVSGAYLFFYLVLQGFVFAHGLPIIAVILAIFGHIGVWRVEGLARTRYEVSL